MRLSTRSKLFASFGVVVVLMGVNMASTLATWGSVRHTASTTLITVRSDARQLRTLTLGETNARTDFNHLAYTQDPATRAQRIADTTSNINLINATYKALEHRWGAARPNSSHQLKQWYIAWTSLTRTGFNQLVPESAAGHYVQAEGLLNGSMNVSIKKSADAMNGVIQANSAYYVSKNNKSNRAYSQAQSKIIYESLFVFLIALALAYFFSRGAGKALAVITGAAASMGATTNEILAAANEHAASANQQSAAVNETTATVDEARIIAEQTAARAKEVADQAQISLQASDQSIEAIDKIAEAMTEIRDRVAAIARDMLNFSEQTQQIGEITATVNNLADQSNILALNASIEAAKAGEQGKGFAVVATEVRNLAEQSKGATERVRGILTDIQRASSAAVMATEQGTKMVELGVELSQQASEGIVTMTDSIRKTSESMQQIAASSHQQSVGMVQVANAMAEVNGSTAQIVAGAQQTELAAENLSQLAAELTSVTRKYR